MTDNIPHINGVSIINQTVEDVKYRKGYLNITYELDVCGSMVAILLNMNTDDGRIVSGVNIDDVMNALKDDDAKYYVSTVSKFNNGLVISSQSQLDRLSKVKLENVDDELFGIELLLKQEDSSMYSDKSKKLIQSIKHTTKHKLKFIINGNEIIVNEDYVSIKTIIQQHTFKYTPSHYRMINPFIGYLDCLGIYGDVLDKCQVAVLARL